MLYISVYKDVRVNGTGSARCTVCMLVAFRHDSPSLEARTTLVLGMVLGGKSSRGGKSSSKSSKVHKSGRYPAGKKRERAGESRRSAT